MDTAEFDAFVSARVPALLRYARMVSADAHDAEDLVQGALAGAYRNRRKLDAGSIEPYVRRSVVNAQASRSRRLLRREWVGGSPPEQAAAGGQGNVDDRLWVVAALRGLPPRQRAVLVLRYLYDLDEAAIASELGVSRGTVKSQASKALASIRASESARRVTEETSR